MWASFAEGKIFGGGAAPWWPQLSCGCVPMPSAGRAAALIEHFWMLNWQSGKG
jgi:hypothetical protein